MKEMMMMWKVTHIHIDKLNQWWANCMASLITSDVLNQHDEDLKKDEVSQSLVESSAKLSPSDDEVSGNTHVPLWI